MDQRTAAASGLRFLAGCCGFQQGLAYAESAHNTEATPDWSAAAALLHIMVCCAAGVLLTISVILMSRLVAARTALKSQVPRVLNLISTVLLAGGIAVSGWATSGQSYSNIASFSNVFLVFFGTVLLLRLLPLVYYSVLGRFETLRDLTNATYYLADMLLVYCLNGLRFVLSLFDILTGLQAQLLFSTAYARQVGACPSGVCCLWLLMDSTVDLVLWQLTCSAAAC